MKFSILLCTRNSQRLIKEVINSLINQYDRNAILEIIIVDYKSADLTLSIAREILEDSNINFIGINCDVRGKSAALVLGLDAARGDYIVIVDDDNILYPDYILEAKKILVDSKIGCVGSQGVVDEKLVLPDWFKEYKSVYAIGLPTQGKKIDWAWGAGTIIKKEAWSKLKSAQFRFVLNPERQDSSTPISVGGEDVELGLAIKLIGYEIKISEKLKFAHKFEQSRLTEDYLLKNSYGVSRAVAAHEIYRAIIYNPNHLFHRLVWFVRVMRKITACCINIIMSYISGKKLNRNFTQSILLGILSGFFHFWPYYSNINLHLVNIHKENEKH